MPENTPDPRTSMLRCLLGFYTKKQLLEEFSGMVVCALAIKAAFDTQVECAVALGVDRIEACIAAAGVLSETALPLCLDQPRTVEQCHTMYDAIMRIHERPHSDEFLSRTWPDVFGCQDDSIECSLETFRSLILPQLHPIFRGSRYGVSGGSFVVSLGSGHFLEIAPRDPPTADELRCRSINPEIVAEVERGKPLRAWGIPPEHTQAWGMRVLRTHDGSWPQCGPAAASAPTAGAADPSGYDSGATWGYASDGGGAGAADSSGAT